MPMLFALRVVSDGTAKNIYKQIAAFPAIRPFRFFADQCPRPGRYLLGVGAIPTEREWEVSINFGDWVNGGAWGTVEGRAILMYYRLGKFQDIRRSATRAMKWAKDFSYGCPLVAVWARIRATHGPILVSSGREV